MDGADASRASPARPCAPAARRLCARSRAGARRACRASSIRLEHACCSLTILEVPRLGTGSGIFPPQSARCAPGSRWSMCAGTPGPGRGTGWHYPGSSQAKKWAGTRCGAGDLDRAIRASTRSCCCSAPRTRPPPRPVPRCSSHPKNLQLNPGCGIFWLWPALDGSCSPTRAPPLRPGWATDSASRSALRNLIVVTYTCAMEFTEYTTTCGVCWVSSFFVPTRRCWPGAV